MPDDRSTRLRFGPFQVDLHTRELWKHGTRLKLSGQPFEILSILLANAGGLVTREELRTKLWPSDTFVDFDHSLNAAINKLRDSLSDSVDSPRYIETLPRRGYRFIAVVELAAASLPLILAPRIGTSAPTITTPEYRALAPKELSSPGAASLPLKGGALDSEDSQTSPPLHISKSPFSS